MEWFRKAAELGDARAMSNLGFMYAEGRGVPKDDVLAYMWANLSIAQGNEKASEIRDLLETRMSGTQIEEAQRLSREWMDKHQEMT